MAKKTRRERQQHSRNPRPGSSLEDHKRVQSQLVPPMATLPALKLASWMNERLPELIWLGLLSNQVGRENSLEIIRSIATRIREADAKALSDLRLSALAVDPARAHTVFLKDVCASAPVRRALRPLLLFPGLPAHDAWRDLIQEDAVSSDWAVVAAVVLDLLDHQSETATDLRWARLLAMVAGGRLSFPTTMKEQAAELLYYPHRGDLRRVRPLIRSAEGALSGVNVEGATDWPKHFWANALAETPCSPLPDATPPIPSPGTTRARLNALSSLLKDHAGRTRATSAVDPRHDSVFGMALYALALTQELLVVGTSNSITGRLALRTILETYLTLAYLTKCDDPDLWRSHRVFGAGQAKLALLKLADAARPPSSLLESTLSNIANEDVWEEFLSIELGHWTKSNLRKMSEDAGVKDEYDRLYSWTSTYTHGHWGAVRDAVFSVCANPLHRLHRIPREVPPALPDVFADAVELADRILVLVDRAYPGFSERLGGGSVT